jgi:pyruvoyl-dependent arginine decarboxylase
MAPTQAEHDVAAPSAAPESPETREETVGLNISIRTGTSGGSTLLSAFDGALLAAGVGNFNLVTLSSVIPTASRIRHVDGPLAGGHGDLLFCVRAEAFADAPGDEAWAGLGWVTDETGGGLFVEHHGHSEAAVVELIENSLADMKRFRGGGGYGDVRMTLASAECVDEPVCALVVAAYRVSSWHDGSEPPPPESAHEDTLVATPPAASPTPASGPGGTHSQVVGDWMAFDAQRRVDEHQNGLENGHRPPRRGAVARVSVEKEVDYATAKLFYKLYVSTFCDLDTLAAGRQLLHEHEFLEEMLDPRVHKYVAWDEDDVAIGMTTVTTDLETVPWVSPTYFAHHYPEHSARGAVYYLGFTLVHPDHRGAHVFHAMIEPMARMIMENKGVVGWDMCLANDEAGLGGSAGRLLTSIADVTIEPIDRQTYYVATFHGPRETANTEE